MTYTIYVQRVNLADKRVHAHWSHDAKPLPPEKIRRLENKSEIISDGTDIRFG